MIIITFIWSMSPASKTTKICERCNLGCISSTIGVLCRYLYIVSIPVYLYSHRWDCIVSPNSRFVQHWFILDSWGFLSLIGYCTTASQGSLVDLQIVKLVCLSFISKVSCQMFWLIIILFVYAGERSSSYNAVEMTAPAKHWSKLYLFSTSIGISGLLVFLVDL